MSRSPRSSSSGARMPITGAGTQRPPMWRCWSGSPRRRRQDRGPKRTAYARAGIGVYWIIDLVARQVEVCTRPVKEGRYRSREVYKAGQQVPVVIAGQQIPPIAVGDIMP